MKSTKMIFQTTPIFGTQFVFWMDQSWTQYIPPKREPFYKIITPIQFKNMTLKKKNMRSLSKKSWSRGFQRSMLHDLHGLKMFETLWKPSKSKRTSSNHHSEVVFLRLLQATDPYFMAKRRIAWVWTCPWTKENSAAANSQLRAMRPMSLPRWVAIEMLWKVLVSSYLSIFNNHVLDCTGIYPYIPLWFYMYIVEWDVWWQLNMIMLLKD